MPVRISGVILPDQKRVEIALTRVYGIGRAMSGKILSRAGVDPSVKVKDLTDKEAGAIREIIERETPVEGELRRDITDNIRRLKDINCYRGTRHMRHLPVHGQRTKTNSRTVRGNVRRTAGSGRRAASEKT
ncbi:MAG: small subunit ribosomal protein S13 [Parcubacteria group bacterium Gr01-1014_106]|nr:MAG: small subunit ribosomal protein S13 [Parcubacteria group bacterium Gr01-1014_106]